TGEHAQLAPDASLRIDHFQFHRDVSLLRYKKTRNPSMVLFGDESTLFSDHWQKIHRFSFDSSPSVKPVRIL
ncbi:MAG TPA: hypothetical protein PKH10_12015, partial [bacterium]|nr:hypothetical protein [bacterium]